MYSCTKCNPIDARREGGAPAGRRKLWQLDRACHGSLIGRCLSPREIKGLCRKLQLAVQDPGADAFQRALITIAGEPSPAARRLHKFMDRKYWLTVLRFTAAHSSAALETLWQEAAPGGEAAGACWALATHPHAPDDLPARLHGELAEPLALRLRTQVEHYAAKLAVERVRAENAEASVAEWRQLAIKRCELHQHLAGQLAELHAERKALEATLERLLLADCTTCTERDDCRTDDNLSGRCILYVGGATRQCAHFHALVERRNGRFLYHDGDLNSDRPRLDAILPRADVVFCPQDGVSRAAARRVRQICTRHRKRLVLLPRASLAAFTRGLNELAA